MKRKSWIVLLFLVGLFSACLLLKQSEKIEEPKKQELTVLEQFGRYIETLIAEGKRSEIDSYRISHPLTIEEGKSLAKESPLFARFSKYGGSEESVLIEADLNEDGIPDLLEAQIRNGTAKLYSFVIYIRKKDNLFYIKDYQPEMDFVKILSEYDELSIVCYQGEKFLLFEENYDGEDGPYPYQITICSIQNGKLTGKYEIQYEYGAITKEIVFCTVEMKEKAEEFCQNAECYYYARTTAPFFQGNIEEPIEKGSKEEVLLKQLGTEESQEYEEKYSKEECQLLFYPITLLSGAKWYESDLDNDGKKELYVKGETYLGMNLYGAGFYRTGELEGEGKIGLQYIIGKDGIRTDFKKLCGLDFWEGSRIPQIFWVERYRNENIVWVRYRDSHYFCGWIEGYQIKEGSYKTVLSIKYQPEVSIQATCEWKTEEELEEILTYGIYLEEKDGIDYPRVYGLEDAVLQEKLERNTEKFFQEEGLEVGKPIRWELKWDGSALYQVISATKEKVVLKYLMLFKVGERGTSEDIYLTIYLKTGEVGFCEDWEVEKEAFQRKNQGW